MFFFIVILERRNVLLILLIVVIVPLVHHIEPSRLLVVASSHVIMNLGKIVVVIKNGGTSHVVVIWCSHQVPCMPVILVESLVVGRLSIIQLHELWCNEAADQEILWGIGKLIIDGHQSSLMINGVAIFFQMLDIVETVAWIAWGTLLEWRPDLLWLIWGESCDVLLNDLVHRKLFLTFKISAHILIMAKFNMGRVTMDHLLNRRIHSLGTIPVNWLFSLGHLKIFAVSSSRWSQVYMTVGKIWQIISVHVCPCSLTCLANIFGYHVWVDSGRDGSFEDMYLLNSSKSRLALHAHIERILQVICCLFSNLFLFFLCLHGMIEVCWREREWWMGGHLLGALWSKGLFQASSCWWSSHWRLASVGSCEFTVILRFFGE